MSQFPDVLARISIMRGRSVVFQLEPLGRRYVVRANQTYEILGVQSAGPLQFEAATDVEWVIHCESDVEVFTNGELAPIESL